MKLRKVKAVFGVVSIALILGGSIGCEKKANDESARVVNVVAGTSNMPFSYLNEDGEYDGYEIAVLKEIDKRLPQYAFRIDGMEFAGMSLALEVGTASIALGTFVRSEARQAKFIFPKHYTALIPINLAVRADRPNVNSLKDLAGMSVASVISTYEHSFLTAWNKAHPDTKFIIKSYNNVKDDDLLRAISSGKVDSALISPASYNTIVKELKITNLRLTQPVFIEDTYFMLAENETALCEDWDNAIKSLLEDGTLGRLSEQYLGGDMFAQYAAQFEAQGLIQ